MGRGRRGGWRVDGYKTQGDEMKLGSNMPGTDRKGRNAHGRWAMSGLCRVFRHGLCRRPSYGTFNTMEEKSYDRTSCSLLI